MEKNLHKNLTQVWCKYRGFHKRGDNVLVSNTISETGYYFIKMQKQEASHAVLSNIATWRRAHDIY